MRHVPATHRRLIFIRHGRASGADGRCIGHTDLSLAAEGAEQIRALCPLLSAIVIGPVQVASSDLRRAMESAAILSAALGVDATLDSRLREMYFGDWDGRTWADLEQSDGNRLRAWTDDWLNDAPPNGERLIGLSDRAVGWLDEVLARDDSGGRTIIVVSHAGWIRVAVSLLLDRALSRLFELSIDHGHATIIDIDGTGPQLVAENVDASSARYAGGGELCRSGTSAGAPTAGSRVTMSGQSYTELRMSTRMTSSGEPAATTLP